jgi:transposase
VSREHRRAKTDRLDTELLMRVFLGWLRGERRPCSMVAIPTIEEEDARRPNRERQNLVTEQTRTINQIKAIITRFGIRSLRPTMRKVAEKLEDLRTAEATSLPQNTLAELRRHLARLRVVRDRIRAVEQERLRKLAATPAAEKKGPHATVGLIARVVGVGVETADMLVNEIFSRHWRDRKAVARYAGPTGSPDESGNRRRERGLARAGNVRVRSGMIELAWRFVRFQKNSGLVQWFAARTADGRAGTRKTMIVALARKLLIAFWRLVTRGEVPQGVVLRPASCATAWKVSNDKTTGLAVRARDLPTNPRWRCPAVKPMASLGPPPRSFADDAHDCIMVRSGLWIDRIQGCGATSAPDGELPSDQVVPIFRRQRLLMSEKGEPHNSNPLERRRMTFVCRGTAIQGSRP